MKAYTAPIEHQTVKSSNIRSVGYDNFSRILEVAFHNGSTFRYHDVDPQHFTKLTTAKSVGAYFHSHIRNAHVASKVS